MVGQGIYKGGFVMPYHYEKISKHNKKVKSAYHELNLLIRDVQKELKGDITFRFVPIGSYSRNMMTHDPKSNKGFDFDINIYPNYKQKVYSAKETKMKFIKAFNKHVSKYGYSNAEDSTRVITIKVKDTKNSKIIYSADFAIVRERQNDCDNYWQEYIRFNKKRNIYNWAKQESDYDVFQERMDSIEDEELMGELWNMYLKLKNYNKVKSKHSIQLLTEAVDNVYHKYFEQ